MTYYLWLGFTKRSLHCLALTDVINNELNAFLRNKNIFSPLKITYVHLGYFSVLLDCVFCDIRSILITGKSKL